MPSLSCRFASPVIHHSPVADAVLLPHGSACDHPESLSGLAGGICSTINVAVRSMFSRFEMKYYHISQLEPEEFFPGML